MMRTVLGLILVLLEILVTDCSPVPPEYDFADFPNELSDPEEQMESRMSLPGFSSIAGFENCIEPPAYCPNENITFWFYTRSTQNDPVEISMFDMNTIKYMKYNDNHPWKLIIHGYTGWKDYSPNTELRPAFFQHGEYNIISVDYGPIVKEPCYPQAANNVPLVGNCTAQMIDTLVSLGIFKLEQLHVIGFSLGGQVTGQVSRFVKSGKIERITGLDPAFPLFIGEASIKLDASDAKFVDVIHTDAGRRGKWEQCGHVDFYPNGGYSQLGCNETVNASVSSCNHARAPIYYAESINSEIGFWGTPCNSYVAYYWGWCDAEENQLVLMGEYTPTTARGVYYLETNDSPPYALGKIIKKKEKDREKGNPDTDAETNNIK